MAEDEEPPVPAVPEEEKEPVGNGTALPKPHIVISTSTLLDQPLAVPESSKSLRPSSPRFYSGRNPVPQLDSLWEAVPDALMNPLSLVSSTPETEPQTTRTPRTPQEEKEYRLKLKEHEQTVTDPVTQREIKTVDAKHLLPQAISRTKPPTAPVSPPVFQLYLSQLRRITVKYIVFVFAVFLVITTLDQSVILALLIAGIGSITWWRRVNSEWDILIADEQRVRSRQRMQVKGHDGDESVEWLNGAIASLWPQINTDIFAPIIDILEDVMQASIPKIVHQVRIADLGMGDNPIQLLSIRWLDESKEDEKVPDDGEGALDVGEEPDEISDSVGEWISLEGAFMYRALPSGANAASKAKNVHLLINVWAGLKHIIATPIPVWAEVKGITGVCRIKMQIIPDPPFIKHLTFSFMGMPKIEITAVPLNQRFVDVMNLPLISDFINAAINTAAREFVAPRSHTLDVYKIIRGEDSKKELDAIGVIVVRIKRATDIKASDITGASDCYVTLSFSKYRKPLWSSRIIFADLYPVWEETAILLVNADELRAKEKLRVDLWDSDRFSADDILGHTELDVTELVENKGKIYDRKDLLRRFEDSEKDSHGQIEWSAVFYGKGEFNKKLETKGQDDRVPAQLRSLHSSMLPPKVARNRSTPANEDQAMYIPPDPAFLSGIISIQVHNIVGLARQEVKSTKRKESQGPSTTEEEEEGANLPSSYVSIILDDQKVYKTRVKPLSSKPFFSAGTERFVRDWRSCNVLIVVKDSRMREQDPILGVVELKLVEQLKTASAVSRWFSIQGGIGYGKIRISILFRPIDTALPRTLQGAQVGSVEIISKSISPAKITNIQVRNADYLAFQTPLVRKTAPRMDGVWVPTNKRGFRLGARFRHAAPCVITFCHDKKILKDKILAASIFWLKDIVDEEDVTLTLPVIIPHDLDRFVQNCLEEKDIEGERTGTVDIVVRIHRGVGHSHRTAGAKERHFADVIAARECLGSIRGDSYDPSSSDSPYTDSSTSSDSDSSDKEVSDGKSIASGISRRHRHKDKTEKKDLHKKERGIMQFKGARTAKWIKGEFKGAGREIKGILEHHGGRKKEGMVGIESEV